MVAANLDGGSARRKAVIYTAPDINTSSGARTHDSDVRKNTLLALDPYDQCVGRTRHPRIQIQIVTASLTCCICGARHPQAADDHYSTVLGFV